MKKQVSLGQEYLKGVWENNPILVQLLGLCPTLAVTVSAINGLAMGLAATFVLVMSSLLISSIRKIIPRTGSNSIIHSYHCNVCNDS